MPLDARIYVAGHTGLAGSAILRRLQAGGYRHLIVRPHSDLELMDQRAVQSFFRQEKPEYVFLAAAKVGGIQANATHPAAFIYENLMIQANVIQAAYEHRVKKLLFLGSSCIYPKHAPQPLKEEYLLTGMLEPTNESYAIAKIAGIKMCAAYNRQYGTNFISVMPNNLYGPNDNYDLESSHVLPALIRKCHEAKVASQSSVLSAQSSDRSPVTGHQSPVVIWGTGKPRREFLYSDDLGDACVFLMNLPEEKYQSLVTNHQSPLVNIGTGEDATIKELAHLAADVVGYRGRFVFDTSKPDGTPRKLLDVSRMTALGWRARIGLREGIAKAYADYLARFAGDAGRHAQSR